MQDQPDQTTLSMRNDPDGLIMSEARDATAIAPDRAPVQRPFLTIASRILPALKCAGLNTKCDILPSTRIHVLGTISVRQFFA
jgi:hypothetical protein